MHIRRASAADAAEICRVHQSSARQLASTAYSPEEIEAWVGPLTAESYARVIGERDVVIAEDERGVIGFGQLDCEKGEIDAVYVSPAAAGEGVGSALLSALEAIGAEHGLSSVHLLATLNATSFYEHEGYVTECEVAYNTRSGPRLRVVSMSKMLAVPVKM